MKRLLIIAVVVLGGRAAIAAQFPQPTATDPRIRQVVYSPNEVYEVTGSYRYTTTIEFQKGETVEYLALGDTIAWQARPMGRRVHLKPVEPRAVTNMTVVTDRRTYYFRLTAMSPRDKRAVTYLLRFTYPTASDIDVNPGAVRAGRGDRAKGQPGTRMEARHCNYSVSGSPDIKLIRACDDGKFTFLEFAKNATLPAFFSVDAEGNESAVNYRMDGKYVVIERVGSVFTLRDGPESLCLFNDDKPLKRGEALPRTSIKLGAGS